MGLHLRATAKFNTYTTWELEEVRAIIVSLHLSVDKETKAHKGKSYTENLRNKLRAGPGLRVKSPHLRPTFAKSFLCDLRPSLYTCVLSVTDYKNGHICWSFPIYMWLLHLIKRESLNLGWPCHLFWPIECRSVPVLRLSFWGLVHYGSLSWNPNQPIWPKAQTSLWEDEGPHRAETSHPSWGILDGPVPSWAGAAHKCINLAQETKIKKTYQAVPIPNLWPVVSWTK